MRKYSKRSGEVQKSNVLVFGVGVKGNAASSFNRIQTKAYSVWSKMLERCYHRTRKGLESYDGCTVCDEWKYFPTFQKWYSQNVIDECHLDKDLLVYDNKVYSPNTCCFIPPYINSSIKKHRGNSVGVRLRKSGNYEVTACGKYIGTRNTFNEAKFLYVQTRDAHVKEIAQEAYDKGDIDKRVYEALMRWTVKSEIQRGK